MVLFIHFMYFIFNHKKCRNGVSIEMTFQPPNWGLVPLTGPERKQAPRPLPPLPPLPVAPKEERSVGWGSQIRLDHLLVGGLEHGFYFSIYLGAIIPTDFHIQRGWNHQPVYVWRLHISVKKIMWSNFDQTFRLYKCRFCPLIYFFGKW